MAMSRVFSAHRRVLVAGLVVSGVVAYAALTAVQGGSAAPAPSPSPVASPAGPATSPATPISTIVTSPTATPTAPPPAAVQPQPVPPGGKVTADAARVHTGDGDCLNVRPNPGTTFAVEPYSCLPEGTLLWLSGPAQEADGEKWRYALGQGWVAVRYTAPEQAPAVRLPVGGRVVTYEMGPYREPKPGTAQGQDVLVAVTGLRDGSKPARFVFPGFSNGLGARHPEISPDGRFIAFGGGSNEAGKSAAIVGDLADGTVQRIEGSYGVGWSSASTLMLEAANCESASLTSYSVYDPAVRTTVPLTGEPAEITFVAWAADGKSAYFRKSNRELLRIDRGDKQVRVGTMAEEDTVWSGEPSPDGRRIVGSGGLTALTVVDLASGQAFKFARAAQRQLPGKCGGSWSKVWGWLDPSHVYYHERSSSAKEDGITVGDLATGKRVVYPFFNVQDLTSPAPGLLAFSTWVSEAGQSFTVTFVLDTVTGQAMPLVTGSGATWVR